MKTTTLFLTAILFAFTACSQNKNSQTSSENAQITTENNQEQEETAQSVKRVTKAEFNAYMADLSDYTIVDIRTAGEFSGGTIDGAVNIDYYSPTFKDEINKLDKSKPVLMFCRSGGRSGQALPIFKSLGFQKVLELKGGYSGY